MTQTEAMVDEGTVLVRAALAGATVDPARVTVVSSQELTVAAGRRRVLRYTVEGLDPTGPVHLIAKVFTELRRAELLCAHLEALARGPFAGGRFGVPELVGFLPEERFVLYRASAGVPLGQLMATAASLDGVRDAARWLATLHTSHVQLPRSFDVAQEVASTHAWATVIARRHPEVLEPARRLAAQWAATAPSGRTATSVPIHKDFHADHVLLGAGVCVIDLDEARQGDAAFDLAHFCTYLEDIDTLRQAQGTEWPGPQGTEWPGPQGTEWPGPQGTEWSGRREAARRAFLDEYVRWTGWVDDGSFARYAAYTWLKIARQLALGSGPFRHRRASSAREVGFAVARGLACLAR